ncbi:MAG: sulfite exporter TauE/SafE family protein [Planctomycetia bacterium]|nr:sulfite exporter TauE/SafE family protein [Planctomycetia bacterium]
MTATPADAGAGGFATLAAATFVAAAVNSVAGGGTILTFPVLAAILPDGPGRLVAANATSTIGLWPGAVAAAWAYRGERAGQPAFARWLVPPSIAGAALGAWLVMVLPPQWFAAVVPWLILLAAVLFALQPRLVGRAAAAGGGPHLGLACGLQLLVAVYGGYFGAGIGILMLAMLGLLGLGDIHRLNAVKNMLGTLVNGVAAALFAVGALAGSQAVSWPHAAVMAASAVAGGLAGSAVARRLPAGIVRRAVALIAFALAGYYFAV